jgi:serine/threonine protein kinase
MSVINLGVPVKLQKDFEGHLRKIIDPRISPDLDREDWRSVSINALSLRGKHNSIIRMSFLRSLEPVIENGRIISFTGVYKVGRLNFVFDGKLGGGAFGNVYRYVHEPTASRGLPKAAFAVKIFDNYLSAHTTAERKIQFESCLNNAEMEAAIVGTLEEAGAFEESTAARVIETLDLPPMIAMELTEGSLVSWKRVEDWTFLDAATTVYAMFRECENVYQKTTDKEYTKPLLYGDFKPDNFLFTREKKEGTLHVIMGDYGSLSEENEQKGITSFVKPLQDSTSEVGDRNEVFAKRFSAWKNTWDNLAFCMGISILTFLKLDKNQAGNHFNTMTRDEIDAHMKNIFESKLTENPEQKLIKHLLNYQRPGAMRLRNPGIRWPVREPKWNAKDIRKEFNTYDAKFKTL